MQVDLAIAGGGVAGAFAGCAAARRGMKCVIIDAGRPTRADRVETLDPRVVGILRMEGAEHVLEEAGASRCSSIIAAWGQRTAVEAMPIFNAFGPSMHVRQGRFRDALLRHAVACGARVIDGLAKLTGQSDGGWQLAPGEIASPLLVVATGRRIMIGRPAMRRRAADRLVAVFFERRAEDPDHGTPLKLWAHEFGWCYSTPVGDNQEQVVLLTDSDLWRNVTPAALEHAGLARGARAKSLSPANLCMAEPAAGHRWIAIGDAAISFDPLAGQGVLHALASARHAAEIVSSPGREHPRKFSLYRADAEQRFGSLLLAASEIYAQETRWSESVFWSRRRRLAEQPLPRRSV